MPSDAPSMVIGYEPKSGHCGNAEWKLQGGYTSPRVRLSEERERTAQTVTSARQKTPSMKGANGGVQFVVRSRTLHVTARNEKRRGSAIFRAV